jgi:hypothetical protein
LSALAASAVLLVSGTAFSGGTSTTNDKLVDFNMCTRELFAFPKGQPLAVYVHTAQTVHLAANLEVFTPPDPCLPLAEAWNATVSYDATHDVSSTFIFEALLSIQSDFACRAAVTSTSGALTGASGALPTIVSITPMPR